MKHNESDYKLDANGTGYISTRELGRLVNRDQSTILELIRVAKSNPNHDLAQIVVILGDGAKDKQVFFSADKMII